MRFRTKWFAVAPVATMLLLSLVLGGCSSDGNNSVPASAMLSAEGTRRLVYTTGAAGTLYVYDRTTSTLIYSGDVDSGRQILVDPDANRITADGTVLQEKKLTSGHTYRVFFQPRENR
jgi:hypothetical protein